MPRRWTAQPLDNSLKLTAAANRPSKATDNKSTPEPYGERLHRRLVYGAGSTATVASKSVRNSFLSVSRSAWLANTSRSAPS